LIISISCLGVAMPVFVNAKAYAEGRVDELPVDHSVLFAP
jgi:hypothetical protein